MRPSVSKALADHAPFFEELHVTSMRVGSDFWVGLAKVIGNGIKLKKLILDGLQSGPT